MIGIGQLRFKKNVQAELVHNERVITKLEERDKIGDENGREDDVTQRDASLVEWTRREKSGLTHLSWQWQ